MKHEPWDSTSAEAHRLVFGARNETYDHPAIDYSRTAALFEALTGIDLSVREAICFMLCVKLSRVGAGLDHDFPSGKIRDSLVDLAGYADCLFAVWDLEATSSLDELLDDIDGPEDLGPEYL